MAETMTQVNVRLSAALKQAGDDAFAAAGLSPSVVIRAAYERAAQLAQSLRGVSDIIAGSDQEVESREQQMAVFERSAHAFEDIAKRYGLQVDCNEYEPMTDEEVEEALYQDYLAEGLL